MPNTIEIRRVVTRTDHDQGRTETETWEYRTKDVLVSILGVSLGSWSQWTPVETITVYKDQNGNIL